jgi:hypothetical protein
VSVNIRASHGTMQTPTLPTQVEADIGLAGNQPLRMPFRQAMGGCNEKVGREGPTGRLKSKPRRSGVPIPSLDLSLYARLLTLLIAPCVFGRKQKAKTDEKRAARVGKRPKSREETPKEGSQ